MRKFFSHLIFLAYSPILFAQTIPNYNIVWGDPQASVGYYFLHAVKISGGQASGFHTMILDRYGRLVYLKKFNSVSNDFKLHPNGLMSYAFTPPGNPDAAKFHIMDSTFYVRDSVGCAGGVFTDGHDLLILPNGHYLMMGFEYRIMNLSSYNWFNGNGSPGSSNASVKCGVIQELDENKNLIFMWKSADYFQFADVDERVLFNPNNVDWTHFNSHELDSDGNILISVRHFNEVTKISRQTGAIIWRLGGKRNQFTFINDPYNGFTGQHDARRIPNGNITIFDNGIIRNTSVNPARAVEYIVNEQNLTASLVWSHIYSNNSSSRFLGNVQRLPNGNTVIGWGGLLNANVTFNCVKPNGSLVMEIKFPDTLYTYRAFNYSTLPWSLNRPVITCFSSGGNYFLDAGSGYGSYLWSTGATTQIIQITSPDTYYVFVPYGQGGYISSERAIITNMNNPCSQIGVKNISNEIPSSYKLYQNYPNPFNPTTYIGFRIADFGFVKLTVYDVLGSEITTLVNEKLAPGAYEVSWDGSNYPPGGGQVPSGVYFYQLTVSSEQLVFYTNTKKLVLIK